MKRCNNCNEEYPIEHFSKHKSSKGGRRKYCKKCAAVKMRNYRKNKSTVTSELRSYSNEQLIMWAKQIDIELFNRGVKK